jgi:dTDP-glucose 4,6-dehydratase
VRDWIHVDDHITALGAVMLRGEPGKDYLIGADNERTNLDMADLITAILNPGSKTNVEFVPDRPGHDRRYAIDHSAITEELGWEPKYGPLQFMDKLRETLEWYRDNTEWMQEVIHRTGVANPHIDLWEKHNIKHD